MEPIFYKEHQMNNNMQDQCSSCLLAQIVGITYLHPCYGDLSVGQIQSVTQVVKTSPENVP